MEPCTKFKQSISTSKEASELVESIPALAAADVVLAEAQTNRKEANAAFSVALFNYFRRVFGGGLKASKGTQSRPSIGNTGLAYRDEIASNADRLQNVVERAYDWVDSQIKGEQYPTEAHLKAARERLSRTFQAWQGATWIVHHCSKDGHATTERDDLVSLIRGTLPDTTATWESLQDWTKATIDHMAIQGGIYGTCHHSRTVDGVTEVVSQQRAREGAEAVAIKEAELKAAIKEAADNLKGVRDAYRADICSAVMRKAGSRSRHLDEQFKGLSVPEKHELLKVKLPVVSPEAARVS